MVLGFEKAFACFLFHLPHYPSADLKFGSKFSHDNAMTDSARYFYHAQHYATGVSSSWPPSSSHSVVLPMHRGSQSPAVDLRGFQPQSPSTPPCSQIASNWGQPSGRAGYTMGRLHYGAELEELNGNVV